MFRIDHEGIRVKLPPKLTDYLNNGLMPIVVGVSSALWFPAVRAFAEPTGSPLSPTNIFAPDASPADSVFHLSMFVLEVTAAIFVVVFALLVYATMRFRRRNDDDGAEPAQIYGSNQVELAWTVIPVLIVVALFLATGRVIADVDKAVPPKNAVKIDVTGHQFWWEYRYPEFNVVTANELHIPIGDSQHGNPTFMTLLSADTDHSFWVPRLAGKTDLIPNHPNSMWIEPHETGLYLGQCAQYCGTQHAKMLLRVYVETQEEFDRWIREQREPAHPSESVAKGRRIFETTACINCHTVSGTVANGRFGPDLTHLMSRETLAAGIVPNTRENLRRWIKDPDQLKLGSLMPAMKLTDGELDQVTAYLESLH
jgi:cytochrome c oxidase subunit 2